MEIKEAHPIPEPANPVQEQESSEFPAMWAGPKQHHSFCTWEPSLYYLPAIRCRVQNLTRYQQAGVLPALSPWDMGLRWEGWACRPQVTVLQARRTACNLSPGIVWLLLSAGTGRCSRRTKDCTLLHGVSVSTQPQMWHHYHHPVCPQTHVQVFLPAPNNSIIIPHLKKKKTASITGHLDFQMLCSLADGPVLGVRDRVWLGVLWVHRVISWKKKRDVIASKLEPKGKNDTVTGRWASWQELEKEQRAMENPQELKSRGSRFYTLSFSSCSWNQRQAYVSTPRSKRFLRVLTLTIYYRVCLNFRKSQSSPMAKPFHTKTACQSGFSGEMLPGTVMH